MKLSTLGKRASNKIKNETEILETAIRLYIDNGAHQTTIADIISETTLARGTFYNYFKTQSEIWDRIISDFIEKLNSRSFRERANAVTIHGFIYDSFLKPLALFDEAPYRDLIAKNPSQFREALFKNDEIDNIISIFENDMRESDLFNKLPESFYKMTAYAMVGSCLEILIQSISKKDNFTVIQISEYIATIFEKSLIAIQEQ